MRQKIAVMILLVCFSTVAMASKIGIIPYGLPPLLNGIVGDAEWAQPGVLEIEQEGVTIRLKQDSLYVYLCVVDRDTVHSGLDLYLDNMAGDISMLHVSSAHGEKRICDSIWGETLFGPTEFWSSNIVESTYQDGKMKFLSPDAFEFQIDKSQLPSRKLKLMFHLKRPELWVPSGPDTLSSRDWIEVDLYR